MLRLAHVTGLFSMEASLTDVYNALQVLIGASGILSGLLFTSLWRGKWFS